MDDQGSAETPWEDLRAGALREYEDAATKVHSWASVIPRAINYYFDHAKPAARVDEAAELPPERTNEQVADRIVTGWALNDANDPHAREALIGRIVAALDTKDRTRARVGTAPQVQEVWNEAIRIALATCRIKADSLRLGAEEGEAPCYAEDIELCQELGSRLAVALSSAKGAAGDRGTAPEVSGADDYIAWCRYVNHGQDEDSGADIITIEICASDAKGAFRVYYKPVAAVNSYRAGDSGSAEWIRVEDDLPTAREEVLFIAEFGGEPMICFGYKAYPGEDQKWYDAANTDRDGDPNEVYGVTHWRKLPPLPALPAEKRKVDGID